MKTKIKFYDVALEEETIIGINEIKTIEEGDGCIIIINVDGIMFEIHEISFI